ncbi:hypothetical protein [Kineosporia babensis]|uniref:Uncharacterized protein n=1 Tax=Kineosporia babensis TaxID=499548 RepID=A0A9X1NBZ5_9ACTN|nr:hypothetical protein [Kineosporia babensis]MCD5310939.1 hypothetical protein [Kineosporia babensis]
MNSIRKDRSVGEWFGYFIGQIIQTALRTWFLMLLLGGLHGSVFPQVPAIGYWQTLLCIVTFDYLLAFAVADGVKIALREELR